MVTAVIVVTAAVVRRTPADATGSRTPLMLLMLHGIRACSGPHLTLVVTWRHGAAVGICVGAGSPRQPSVSKEAWRCRGPRASPARVFAYAADLFDACSGSFRPPVPFARPPPHLSTSPVDLHEVRQLTS